MKKEQLIELISNKGTWQTTDDGREGTFIDAEDIDSIADEILSKLQQPIVISAVCEHCGSDRIKLCSHDVVDYCLDCHNFTSKTDL